MSDKKISELTAATTADGTEPLPIVQSGETKKATGKVVVSGAVSDLAQTWNAAGTTFTGLKLNVTDTASASGSLLLDVQKGGTSQVVIDKNGRLGIGPSAPAQKLDVYGAGAVFADIASSDANAVGIRLGISAVANRANVIYTSSGLQLATVTATPLLFQTNGTEKMRLDSSGNLGLGVTPSAWGSGYVAAQLGGSTSIADFTSGTNVQINILNNNYLAAGNTFTYTTSAAAAAYRMISGIHYWLTAPSGTAGNAVTLTERLRLTAASAVFNEDGNDYDTRIEGDTDANLFFVDASTDRVGIGTNAPAYKFDVAGTARFSASSNSFVFANTVTVFNNAAADVDFQVQGDTDANLLFVDASTDRVGIGTNTPFGKLNVLWNSADSDQVRFTNTSSGSNNYLSFTVTGATGHNIPGWSNSGVIECVQSGATTGDKALYLGAFNGPILFATGSGSRNIRATLDTSGNLGIGTSAPGDTLHVSGTARIAKSDTPILNFYVGSTRAGYVYSNSGTKFIVESDGRPLYLGASANQQIELFVGGTERARVDKDGNVVINNAAIATNATNGFLYVPSCAGTPTGTPTAYTGRVPIVVDSTNNKLYFYSGGAWRDAGP